MSRKNQEHDFLESFLNFQYRQARNILRRAEKLGVTPGELVKWDPELIDFLLNLMEAKTQKNIVIEDTN